MTKVIYKPKLMRCYICYTLQNHVITLLGLGIVFQK